MLSNMDEQKPVVAPVAEKCTCEKPCAENCVCPTHTADGKCECNCPTCGKPCC